jgi:hypothetical protein
MTKNTYLALGIILVIVIVAYMAYNAEPSFIVSDCDPVSIEKPCSVTADCYTYFEGAPQDWLDSQGFECKSGVCWMNTPDCGSDTGVV